MVTRLSLLALVLLSAHSANAAGTCFDCSTASSCVQCLSKTVGTNDVSVSLSASSCKGSAISWMCCKTTGCTVDTCDGTITGNKCDELENITLSVPIGTTSLNLQMHDGKLAGDVLCSAPGACCGGSGTSCSATSGVCNVQVDITDCPTPDEPECTSDTDCSIYDPVSSCGKMACIAEECQEVVDESGSICRSATGICDVAEVCDGVSLDCPVDAYAPNTTVCRPASDLCDLSEMCTGSDVTCPKDMYAPNTTVCRQASDLCDLSEMCTGSDVTCPTDVRYTHGSSFKCGRTCYVCAVQPQNLLMGRTTFIDTCNLGSCATVEFLPWPACTDVCIARVCPNGKDLSNAEFYSCVPNTGSWRCDKKVDVSSATVFPVCA